MVFAQSLSKKIQSEPYYHQPAMESYDYDSLFFIAYAQVSFNKSTVVSLRFQLVEKNSKMGFYCRV